jgi:hypothetical protein
MKFKKRGDEIKKKIFSSETTEPISTKFVEIGSVVSEWKIFLISSPLFSNLHNRSKSVKVKKRGDEIKKKSSPLKLLSQFQPNFAEMIQ